MIESRWGILRNFPAVSLSVTSQDLIDNSLRMGKVKLAGSKTRAMQDSTNQPAAAKLAISNPKASTTHSSQTTSAALEQQMMRLPVELLRKIVTMLAIDESSNASKLITGGISGAFPALAALSTVSRFMHALVKEQLRRVHVIRNRTQAYKFIQKAAPKVRVLAIADAATLNVVTWDGEWPRKRDQMMKKVLKAASRVETLAIAKVEGTVCHALKQKVTNGNFLAGAMSARLPSVGEVT